MRVPAILLSILVALAGCSDAGGTDAADAEVLDADDAGAVGPNATVPPEPVVEVVSVLLEGNLGIAGYACEYQNLGLCHGFGVVPDETDLYHEQPGATLVGATLTLEWDATSPATDTLAMGLMRTGDNSTQVGAVEGTSPLTLEATDLDLLLDDENTLHVYVYNVRGNVHQPPFVAYATTDQPFTVAGNLTLRT